jgi:rod shape-determining protein MreD
MMTLNIRLCIALFLVLVLSIIPMPDVMLPFRPPWVLLLVLYIQVYLPNYYTALLLFVLGLCLDVLLATLIGVHSFALLLTTWIAAGKLRRFIFFSMAQQMLMVGVFCICYESIIVFIEAFIGFHNNVWLIPGTVLLSICLWPWIRVLADNALCYDPRP